MNTCVGQVHEWHVLKGPGWDGGQCLLFCLGTLAGSLQGRRLPGMHAQLRLLQQPMQLHHININACGVAFA